MRSLVLTHPSLTRAEISIRIETRDRVTFETLANVFHIAGDHYQLQLHRHGTVMPDELMQLHDLLQRHYPNAVWRCW